MIRQTRGFPFELSSTKVDVEPENVTISYGQFFNLTTQTVMLPIEDIKTVEVDTDPFFGTLVMTHGMPETEIRIPKFSKSDAWALESQIKSCLGKGN